MNILYVASGPFQTSKGEKMKIMHVPSILFQLSITRITQAFLVFFLAQLVFVLPAQTAPLGNSREVQTLLARAQAALDAGHITNPPKDNLVTFVDRVFRLSPGNSGAYTLLYSALDSLEKAEQSTLSSINSMNRTKRLHEAEGYLETANLLIARYRLTPEVQYRMSRQLQAVQTGSIPGYSRVAAPPAARNTRVGSGKNSGSIPSLAPRLAMSWNYLRVIGRF